MKAKPGRPRPAPETPAQVSEQLAPLVAWHLTLLLSRGGERLLSRETNKFLHAQQFLLMKNRKETISNSASSHTFFMCQGRRVS